jgi:hypothetical protein
MAKRLTGPEKRWRHKRGKKSKACKIDAHWNCYKKDCPCGCHKLGSGS